VLTLGGAFEVCLEAKGARLAPGTIKSYRQDFDSTFGDWRSRPFAAITPDMAQRRHQERSKDSGTRADGAMRVLRLVWRFTKANAEVDGKPFAVPDPLAKIRVANTWNGTPRRRSYLDAEQRGKWLAAVLALPDDKPPALTGTQRDALLLLIATGLRLREGVRVAWKEVDLSRGIVTLGASRMKGGEEHVLPIPKRTLAMLKNRRKVDPDGVYAFAGVDGGPLDRISKRTFDRIEPRASPHDLRRTAATWLGTNAPGYVVKQILSHADPSKASDVTAGYVGRDLDALRIWLQKWEDALYASKRGRK
jgi:integrase